MRLNKLISFDEGQAGNLRQLIQRHRAGERFVFSAIIPDSPTIPQLTAQRKAVAVHSAEGRAWFDAVCQELERKMH